MRKDENKKKAEVINGLFEEKEKSCTQSVQQINYCNGQPYFIFSY